MPIIEKIYFKKIYFKLIIKFEDTKKISKELTDINARIFDITEHILWDIKVSYIVFCLDKKDEDRINDLSNNNILVKM